MIDPERQPERVVQADAWIVSALAVVLLAGFVARSLVTLIPPLVVNDGAYYLVQVRAILRGGALAIPDFPFLFYVQAC